MTDKDDNRLEDLLGAWGRDQGGRLSDACLTLAAAAAVAENGPADGQAEHVQTCPRCARMVGRFEAQDACHPGGTPLRMPRWLPLAAAVAIVAAGLLVGAWHGRATRAELAVARADRDALGRQATTLRVQSEKSRQDRLAAEAGLAQSRAVAEEARAAHEQMRTQLADAVGKVRQLGKQVAAYGDWTADRKRLDRELADAVADARALDADLTNARALAVARGADLARIQSDTAAEIDRWRQRAADLAGQLRQRRDADGEQLAVVRTTWKMLLAEAKAAPIAPTVLANMQSAARAANLAGRISRAGAGQVDKDTARLLGQLEAAMIRLDLASPSDAFDQRWLGGAARGELLGQIDAALAGKSRAGALPGDVRLLLAQAQVILLRGACAI